MMRNLHIKKRKVNSLLICGSLKEKRWMAYLKGTNYPDMK